MFYPTYSETAPFSDPEFLFNGVLLLGPEHRGEEYPQKKSRRYMRGRLCHGFDRFLPRFADVFKHAAAAGVPCAVDPSI